MVHPAWASGSGKSNGCNECYPSSNGNSPCTNGNGAAADHPNFSRTAVAPTWVIAVGAYVQISGTGGDGLRLRTDPGLDSEVRILGAESEVFQVEDGPKDVDGFTWWYLVGPYDASRRGWAVSNYLSVVQNP